MNTKSSKKFLAILRIIILALFALNLVIPVGAANYQEQQVTSQSMGISALPKNLVNSVASVKASKPTSTQTHGVTPTPTATTKAPTVTVKPQTKSKATSTSTKTPTKPASATPAPTNTTTTVPTSTATPLPISTDTPMPTNTPLPVSTVILPPTNTVEPTVTSEPTQTSTPTSQPSPTPVSGIGPVPAVPGTFQLAVPVHFKVNQTGLYRVTYEKIQSAGLDLAGILTSKIAVINRDLMIPVRVYTPNLDGTFGPGAYIEFYGEAVDTIYTDTNIYTLQISNTSTPHIPDADILPDLGQQPENNFTASITTNRQINYDPSSPGSEPWGDTTMMVYTASKSWDFIVQADNLADPAAPSSLKLTVWGITDWSKTPDHHLLVSLNGTIIDNELFDGHVEKILNIPIPAGTLRSGENTLRLTMPGDTGVSYETITLDQYTLTYQRSFYATNGRLSFTSSGDLFQVSNLPSADVVVYRSDDDGILRIANVQTEASGTTFKATFAGSRMNATYYVNSTDTLLSPIVEMARPKIDLNQPTQYLIISHPDFINGLQPFVEAKQAQGFTVNVVDVNDIYEQYSYGIFDPEAIKLYISDAANSLGTEYVLLVGADSFDYRNRLGMNYNAYIPSLYTAISSINFSPVDPLYTDFNDDEIPDLPIGRFPVHNNAELSMIIDKTLVYASRTYASNAVFASDQGYMGDNDNLAARLSPGWSAQNIHLDQIPVGDAQTQLLTAMNNTASLVSYLGHSSFTSWTTNNFFTASIAQTLTNHGRPFVVVQWGCYGNLDNDPRATSLVQGFLFSGDQGAAAVMGTQTLSGRYPEQIMGLLLMPHLAEPGMTLGLAIQQAKSEYVSYADSAGMNQSDRADILLAWTLMGDPSLVIQP